MNNSARIEGEVDRQGCVEQSPPSPGMFSQHTPKLQLAVDATSLRALMFCPRYYQYTILEGWAGSNIDLEFGILAHKAMEVYNKTLIALEGDPDAWAEAQLAAVRTAFTESWKDGPWRGTYMDMWRCKGETKYKNAKGNPAKCPYSHKGVWHEAPGPEYCGECGSLTEAATRWLPDHKYKHRYNLLRLIAWYCEEDRDSHWHPILYKGTPAVEVSFKHELPYHTEEDEPFVACGYIDCVKAFGGEIHPDAEFFITDLKTTKNTLSASYYATFSPHVQVDFYDLLASFLFPDLKIKGVLIEAAQLLVEGVRFGKYPAHRTDLTRMEFLDDLAYWLGQLEDYAKYNYWPMNRANCWNCGFKDVCSARPDMRERLLEASFEKRIWDPTKERT